MGPLRIRHGALKHKGSHLGYGTVNSNTSGHTLDTALRIQLHGVTLRIRRCSLKHKESHQDTASFTQAQGATLRIRHYEHNHKGSHFGHGTVQTNTVGHIKDTAS